MCIGDNAYFYSGGGHTLVGTNYAHVACSVYGQKILICGSFGYSTWLVMSIDS